MDANSAIDTPLPPGEYCIVEIMGHTTLVGRYQEVERFGTKMLAIEPLFRGELLPVVFHGGQSIYRLTPCSAEIAKAKGPTRIYQLPSALVCIVPPLLLEAAEAEGLMFAITIWQPWASLIAAGAKPYEWRGWEAPRRLIGQRIAIHAGARKVRREEIAELLLDIRHEGSAGTSLDVAIAVPLLERWHVSPGALPLSSVVCTAVLGQPVAAAAYARQTRQVAADSDRIDHTKWGWPLTDIQAVEPMAPAKGAQGFWMWRGPDA